MKERFGLVPVLFIPTILIQFGSTAGMAFVPLYAKQLGAPVSTAAFIAALMYLGQAIADLPGGWLVHRFGEKRIMCVGAALSLLAMIWRYWTRGITGLALSVLLYGIGTSFVWISRMAWLKQTIDPDRRGYIMSYVGGSLRIAAILGPLVGGFIAEGLGYRSLFVVQGLLNAAALVMFITFLPKSSKNGHSYALSVDSALVAWRTGRRSIIAAAAGISGLTVLRSARPILISLRGDALDLGESQIGLILFAGAALDAGLFWISGIVMTRSGRKTAAVACTAILTTSLIFLPTAQGLPGLLLLSLLAGFGNAMGAGINLTISGDLAPSYSPAAFLSFWRFSMGVAGFGGPALAAWAIGIAGFGAAPLLIGAMGLAGASVMARFMKETRPDLRRTGNPEIHQ